MKKTFEAIGAFISWFFISLVSAGVVVFIGGIFFGLLVIFEAIPGSAYVPIIVGCAAVGVVIGSLIVWADATSTPVRVMPGHAPNLHPMYSAEWYMHEEMNRNDRIAHGESGSSVYMPNPHRMHTPEWYMHERMNRDA